MNDDTLANGNLPIIEIDIFLQKELPSIKIYPQDVVDFNPNIVTEEARSSNTSFKYSGRHDHGNLPELRSSGEYAKLCNALYRAKDICDELLTNEINLVNAIPKDSDNADNNNSRKKIKVENTYKIGDLDNNQVVDK